MIVTFPTDVPIKKAQKLYLDDATGEVGPQECGIFVGYATEDSADGIVKVCLNGWIMVGEVINDIGRTE